MQEGSSEKGDKKLLVETKLKQNASVKLGKT